MILQKGRLEKNVGGREERILIVAEEEASPCNTGNSCSSPIILIFGDVILCCDCFVILASFHIN